MYLPLKDFAFHMKALKCGEIQMQWNDVNVMETCTSILTSCVLKTKQ